MKTNNGLKNRINDLIALYKRNINDNSRRIKMGSEISAKLYEESECLRTVIKELQEILKPKSEK